MLLFRVVLLTCFGFALRRSRGAVLLFRVVLLTCFGFALRRSRGAVLPLRDREAVALPLRAMDDSEVMNCPRSRARRPSGAEGDKGGALMPTRWRGGQPPPLGGEAGGAILEGGGLVF